MRFLESTGAADRQQSDVVKLLVADILQSCSAILDIDMLIVTV